MDFKELTNEQKAKIQECKTPEELLALIKEEGYELSDDELETIAAGGESGEKTWILHEHVGS